MRQELEIVYTPEASEVSKSIGDLAHLVQTLTPDDLIFLGSHGGQVADPMIEASDTMRKDRLLCEPL